MKSQKYSKSVKNKKQITINTYHKIHKMTILKYTSKLHKINIKNTLLKNSNRIHLKLEKHNKEENHQKKTNRHKTWKNAKITNTKNPKLNNKTPKRNKTENKPVLQNPKNENTHRTKTNLNK